MAQLEYYYRGVTIRKVIILNIFDIKELELRTKSLVMNTTISNQEQLKSLINQIVNSEGKCYSLLLYPYYQMQFVRAISSIM